MIVPCFEINAALKETIAERRMYAEPQLGSMCPVNTFKKYFSKYFSKLQKKLDASLQRPLETLLEESTTWYCKSL